MIKEEVDLLIVGAGPSGLFAAIEALAISPRLKVAVREAGPKLTLRSCPARENQVCKECSPCRIIGGIGGAGLFSDGKLVDLYGLSKPSECIRNNKTCVFHYLENALGGDHDINHLLSDAQRVFLKVGAQGERYPYLDEKVAWLHDVLEKYDCRFVFTDVNHIGTDRLPKVVRGLLELASSLGVDIRACTPVRDVCSENCHFIAITPDILIESRNIIFAPGRVGAGWLRRQCDLLGLSYSWDHVDIGIRVETNKTGLSTLFAASKDPKIHYTSEGNRLLRTFCMCEGGKLVPYYDGLGINVGGASNSLGGRSTRKTNFAALIKIMTSDSPDIYRLVAKWRLMAREQYGNQPVIDTLIGFLENSSNPPSDIKATTLPFGCPGDVAALFPSFIANDLREFILRLIGACPSLIEKGSIVSGPVSEWTVAEHSVTSNFESEIEGLFIIGDACGKVQGIVSGAVSGLLAARKAVQNLV